MNHVSLVSSTTLGIAYAIAGILSAILISRPRKRTRPWWRHVIVSIVLGAAIGGTAIWIVGDVLNEFDVPPTWVDRIWTGVMVAGVCLGVVNLVFAPWGRKIVAVIGIAAIVVAGGLAINRDVGEYQTLGQAIGTDQSGPLDLPKPLNATDTTFDPALYTTWHAPKIMPRRGRVGSVRIPATLSHFKARNALVYLPPAALVASAPPLPVIIMMSGQPGSPTSVMTSGRVPAILNAFARKNHGLAPIVVVPDQLGAASANPMCVNGPLGNSETYLLDDVPNWIRSHLHVASSRLAWAVGGFSQGATCSIQFATAHPDLFGSFIDVSGQQYPTLTTDDEAIQAGFDGSAKAFEAAKPATAMREHEPYPNTVALFAAGQNDAKYRHDMVVMSDLAQKAGIQVTRYISPGSAHDWTTASNGFAAGFALLYPRLGLSKAAPKP
jgi:S-formylglutathione hydrolase FrmB